MRRIVMAALLALALACLPAAVAAAWDIVPDSEPAVAQPPLALWTDQFGSPSWDNVGGVAVDGLNNTYVVGSADFGCLTGQPCFGGRDAFIRKYDPSGEAEWTHQFGTSASDSATSVLIDPSGNIIVVGSTGGAMGQPGQVGRHDIFVRAFDSEGSTLSTFQFGTGGVDTPWNAAIDGSGAIYITGYTNGTFSGQTSSGGYDAFVLRWDPTHGIDWVQQFGTGGSDGAWGVKVLAAGDVYVTGWVSGALPESAYAGGQDGFIRKYGPSGEEEWTDQFGSGGDDFGAGLLPDADGNILLAGAVSGALPGQEHLGGYDAFLRKYGSTGAELLVEQFGTPGDDLAWGMLAHGDSVLVAGSVTGVLPGTTAFGGRDGFLAEFNDAGQMAWVAQFGTGADDYAGFLAPAGPDEVTIVGNTYGVFPGEVRRGDLDVFVRRYVLDPSAEQLVAALVGQVEELNLQVGISSSLDAKLQNALKALADINANNNGSAINKLEAFINEVEAQAGTMIPQTDADDLISLAQRIIALLQT